MLGPGDRRAPRRAVQARRQSEEAIAEIDEVERRLAGALERTPLPAEPDRAAVDGFLVEAYRRHWGW